MADNMQLVLYDAEPPMDLGYFAGIDRGQVDSEEARILQELMKNRLSKSFRYSRVLLVGKGRAGKTALSHSLQGIDFVEDGESTVGVENALIQVNKIDLEAKGNWKPYSTTHTELDQARARLAGEHLQRKAGTATKSNDNLMAEGKIVDFVKSKDARAPNSTPAAATTADHPSFEGGASTVSNEGAVLSDSAAGAAPDSANAASVPDSASEVGNERAAGNHDEKDTSAVAPAKEEEAGPVNLNLDLVFQYKNTTEKEPLKLSIWDFGGQEVFYTLHHLFLSRYGVYLLAFNMEWLVEAASKNTKEEECFRFLKFWLNSIMAHTGTWSTKSLSGAPILLIGTHKDKIKSRVEHERISELLYQKFGNHPAWALVLSSVAKHSSGLHFFPVDNTKGQSDGVVQDIMQTVEQTVEEEDYIKRKVPLEWIAVFDELRVDQRASISFHDLVDIARRLGLQPSDGRLLEEEVKYMAVFFSGLGFIMYHDEPKLSHLVVLNPAKFLIGPATKLVCNLKLHVIKEHNNAKRKLGTHYRRYKKGFVSKRLFPIFWADNPHQQELEELLVKFGILVPLISASAASGPEDEVEFLLPAMLPEAKADPPRQLGVTVEHTCYLVFSTKEEMDQWDRKGHVTLGDVAELGFFPFGVFPRLLGQAISKMQETSDHFDEDEIKANQATFRYGGHVFRLVSLPDEGCIRLEILVKSALVTTRTILDQAKLVLSECVKNLSCNIGVPEAKGSERLVLLGGEKGLWKTVERQKAFTLGYQTMQLTEIRSKFESYLPPKGLRDSYDVFLSYRWTKGLDEDLAEGLFLSLSDKMTNTRQRPEVFLDKERLEAGSNFQDDFAVALTNSRVIVPVLSHAALARMKTVEPRSGIDNLLLEWTLASILLEKKVLKCYPVMFGGLLSTPQNGVFVSSLFDRAGTRPTDLPDTTCKSIVDKTELLLRNMKDLPGEAHVPDWMTVKATVSKITNHMGLKGWDPDPQAAGQEPSAQFITSNSQHAVALFKKKLINDAADAIIEIINSLPEASSGAAAMSAPSGSEVSDQVNTNMVVLQQHVLQQGQHSKISAAQAEAEQAKAEAAKFKMEAEVARAELAAEVKARADAAAAATRAEAERARAQASASSSCNCTLL